MEGHSKSRISNYRYARRRILPVYHSNNINDIQLVVKLALVVNYVYCIKTKSKYLHNHIYHCMT